MVQPWIILLWFCNSMMWETCESVYQAGTTERILRKISKMAWELVIDANSKIELVQSFKSSHANQRVYQWGDLVYKIRKNLKRMVLLYRQALAVIESGKRDENKDVSKLIEVERLGREIDHLVAMIELSIKNSRKPVIRIGKSLRTHESKIWRNLMDSDNLDLNPKPLPLDTDRSGRKINQKWQFAVVDEFKK